MRKKILEDGLVIHEILDPKTTKRYTKYYWKRKIAPRVELRDKISKQYAGYSLIEKDLRNVLTWLDHISTLHTSSEHRKSAISPDRETYSIIKGLYVAALTFYGKCFTTCEGRKIKLDKNFIGEEHTATHTDIIHLRNNFAAHSGSDNFEEVKIVLVLNPKKQSNYPPRLTRELMQPDLIFDLENSFLKLVRHVQQKVLEKMNKIENKIYQNVIFTKDLSYWYKRAKK